MSTRTRILLPSVVLALLGVQPVFGGGGDGGVILLPHGGPEASTTPRASYHYAAGTDVHFRLRDSMNPCIVQVLVEGTTAGSLAYVNDGVLTLRGSELNQIHQAGVERFSILLVNQDGLRILLNVSYDGAGDVSISVH